MEEKQSFKKEGRTFAWEILLKEGFVSLPINPRHFLAKYHIQAVSYSAYAKSNHLTEDDIYEHYNDDGFIVFTNGGYYFIFNQEKSRQRIRWTSMYAVSHYLLKHITPDTPILLRHDRNRTKKDIEADNLTARILCPSIVLHTCGVSSAGELSALCDISPQAAEYRFSHLKQIRLNNRFLSFEEESAVLAQFAPFICSYLCQKYNQQADTPHS